MGFNLTPQSIEKYVDRIVNNHDGTATIFGHIGSKQIQFNVPFTYPDFPSGNAAISNFILTTYGSLINTNQAGV